MLILHGNIPLFEMPTYVEDFDKLATLNLTTWESQLFYKHPLILGDMQIVAEESACLLASWQIKVIQGLKVPFGFGLVYAI